MISRPLVAATSTRRCESANTRAWTAQASRDSWGISTDRKYSSGRCRPGSTGSNESFIVVLSLSWAASGRAPSVRHGLIRPVHDRFAKLPQLGLHDSLVRRSHAQQQLLPRRQALELGIRVLIEYLRLRDLQGSRHIRCLQHVINDLDQAVVEILARIAQV